MLKRISKWLTTKPATKAAWLTLLAVSFIQTIIIFQNSCNIKTAQDAFSLSVTPTLDIEFQSDRVLLRNTSNYPMLKIEAYPIVYKIDTVQRKITNRTQPGGRLSILARLEPKQSIEIPNSTIIFIDPVKTWGPPNSDESIVWSLVIVFRREVDQRRFVRIEPFFAVVTDGKASMLPVYAYNNVSHGGPPDALITITQEIERTEKQLFRANEY